MGTIGGRRAVIAAALLVLVLGSEAWAWGPGTHVKLASDILSNLWLLPAGVAAVIAKSRRYFVFGNVATDTVFAKRMSRIKQVCHQWKTGFGLLESAETDAGRAFAYGYLAHLAADTVAHNKFLPHQMAVSRSTISFGHLYWEIRADAPIDRVYWGQLRARLRGRYAEPERLLESHLQETMLSFRTNRLIFKRMNLLASERAWRRSVEFWSRLSRFPLDEALLAMYHADAVERVVDVLCHGASSAILLEDPSGNAALGYARAQRKQLRQMKRAGMPHDHVIQEAVAGHAPRLTSHAAKASQPV
ncbi:MAG: zinc dependent phospholipase C family protein [Phycisphaerae bacterium]|nr:zinc dependent phospholipase C family protein [Phycisphaerae bacterium]